MITEENKRTLYNITAELSLRDFKSAQPKKPKRDRKADAIKHNLYTLAEDTLEALEMYKTALKQGNTKSEIEMVKAYLLTHKLVY